MPGNSDPCSWPTCRSSWLSTVVPGCCPSFDGTSFGKAARGVVGDNVVASCFRSSDSFFTLPVSDREFATTNPLSMFHARLNSYCAALNSVPDSIERWPVAECGTCWDTLASRVKCLERLSALTDQTRVVSKPGSKKGSATSIQQQYGAILTTLTRAEVFSSSHKCDLQWNGHPLSSRSGRCLETEGPAWIVCITSLPSNLLHFPGCKRFERGSRGSQFWV